jgi:hypothetical protein
MNENENEKFVIVSLLNPFLTGVYCLRVLIGKNSIYYETEL